MPNPKNKGRWDSPGHQLIFELQRLIKDGQPLSPESAKKWDYALSVISVAKNKKEAAECLFRMLDLKFKSGAPKGDAEMTVFIVELLKIEKVAKTKAFVLLSEADENDREDTAFRKAYYDYRKKYPENFASIKHLAQLQRDQGKCMVDNADIALFLAVVNQMRMFPDNL